MIKRKKTLDEKLYQGNYKLTPQRYAVLQVMLNNIGRHLTAEDVLYEAREFSPNIGIATVYRTLEKLSSIDILYKTMFESGKFRYELSGDEHKHHHFICVDCGKIIEVAEDLLDMAEKQMVEQGFQVIDHELNFYGYCPECKMKTKNKK